MRIHRLRLANYRGVVEREVAFAPTGVTVVQGPNEVGKTSLAEALDLLLDHYDDTQKAAVRAVKPVDRDAGAEIEAELSAGPYRFTYAKRFHKERATTLTVHEPAPLQKTGREAHDAVRAMLAETVDEALWRAQRLYQGAGVEQADLRDQTALARALDQAAAAPAAGDRETSLYQRVTEEYHRYHTATGRPNATVKETVAAHEAAQHDANLVRKQLAEVEADIERCAALARDLARCQRRIDEHRLRLPELEQAWNELTARRQEVHRLRLAAELAASEATAAEAALDGRRGLAEDVVAARATVERLQQDQDRCGPAAAAMDLAYQRAADELAERQAALRAARQQAADARGAYERQRDRLDLELMAERAARVASAQRRAADAAAELDRVRIGEEALGEIEAANLALLQARARLEGDHPVLEVHPVEDAEVLVGGRRVPSVEGATLPVTEPVDVTVPGVVAVRVRPGAGVAAIATACSDAQEQLAAHLSAAGVADVAEARRAHRRREEAERARAEAQEALRRDLRDLTPELLADKVRRLREEVGDEDVPSDLDPARESVVQADAAVQSCVDAVAHAEDVLSRAAGEREAARRTQIELTVHVEAAQAALTDRSAALAAAREALPDQHLTARAVTCAQEAVAARAAHEDGARALDATDPDAAKAALDNARAVADRDAADLRTLEGDLRETRARVDLRGEEGLADRLAEAEALVSRTGFLRERMQARAAAVRLLHETMTARRDEARQAYVAPFRDKIVALGRIVFGPDLSVEVDEDLAITSRTLHGITVPFPDLSAGAREQLAVIARLACAAITSQDGGVPLILDDALGYSDPARLEALGAVFTLAAPEAQVIVLTCMPDRYRHLGSAHVIRLD
ncbi:MAG TPA: AAA family ATPase [Egibacteraceae bacterium]|nr:AAA family ATPase [Egibacteraceae bacterium]